MDTTPNQAPNSCENQPEKPVNKPKRKCHGNRKLQRIRRRYRNQQLKNNQMECSDNEQGPLASTHSNSANNTTHLHPITTDVPARRSEVCALYQLIRSLNRCSYVFDSWKDWPSSDEKRGDKNKTKKTVSIEWTGQHVNEIAAPTFDLTNFYTKKTEAYKNAKSGQQTESTCFWRYLQVCEETQSSIGLDFVCFIDHQNTWESENIFYFVHYDCIWSIAWRRKKSRRSYWHVWNYLINSIALVSLRSYGSCTWIWVRNIMFGQ